MKFVVFGGGGHVARHFARLASKSHSVVSVVRNDAHVADLKELGATPEIFDIETLSIPEITAKLKDLAPDAVIFSAGSGGKGGPERTRAVDFEGSVKVYEACVSSGIRRLLLVSAIDVRDRSKGYPAYYNEESRKGSDRVWSSIGNYMQAKYDSEKALHAMNLDYTVLRPGLLTHEPAGKVELGITQMGAVSRESVAQVLLACALEPKTAGLTLDLMDGNESVDDAVRRVVEERVDAWTG